MERLEAEPNPWAARTAPVAVASRWARSTVEPSDEEIMYGSPWSNNVGTPTRPHALTDTSADDAVASGQSWDQLLQPGAVRERELLDMTSSTPKHPIMQAPPAPLSVSLPNFSHIPESEPSPSSSPLHDSAPAAEALHDEAPTESAAHAIVETSFEDAESVAPEAADAPRPPPLPRPVTLRAITSPGRSPHVDDDEVAIFGERIVARARGPGEDGLSSSPAPIRGIPSGVAAALALALDADDNNTCTQADLWSCASHWPCKSTTVFRCVRERIVDVNSVDASGRTALIQAAMRGKEGVVLYLLQRGAAVDCQDYKGYTALMMACFYGHGCAAQLLLEAGARADIERARGQTARDIASHPITGYPMLVRILDEFKERSSSP